MDAVPEDVITHILSFLSGNDVSRFQQLSRYIRIVIKDNRRSLNFPKVVLKISDDTDLNIKNVEFSVNNKITYFFDCSNLNALKPTGRFEFSDFFSWRFEKNSNITFGKGILDFSTTYSLCSILEYIFERGDVKLLLYIKNAEFIKTVTESLRNMSNFVYEVDVLTRNQDDPAPIELLDSVVIRRSKFKGGPKMRLIIEAIGPTWVGFRKLNEIASRTGVLSLSIQEGSFADFMKLIAMEWRKKGFPKIFFNLDTYGPIPISRNSREQAVSRVLTVPDIQFEVFVKDQLKYVALTDRTTVNVIQFSMTHENNYTSLLYATKKKLRISVFAK